MKTTLTVTKIRKKHTEEDIKNIFEKNGIYNKKRNNKKSENYGMISVINKENSLFYFSNYTLAYHYFLKMNWI
jgi:hypothetical protein